MMRIGLPLLATTLAIATTGFAPVAAQSPDPVVTRLTLAGSAKRYCSAIWVSLRDRKEALQGSVLLTAEAVAAYERGALRFGVDDERQIVTASQDGVTARARHFGD